MLPSVQHLFTKPTYFPLQHVLELMCSWIVQRTPHTFALFIYVISVASCCIVFMDIISCHIESSELKLTCVMLY